MRGKKLSQEAFEFKQDVSVLLTRQEIKDQQISTANYAITAEDTKHILNTWKHFQR
jgi:hypothetical protein